MPDLFHLTPEMNQYFNALPESVKERSEEHTSDSSHSRASRMPSSA